MKLLTTYSLQEPLDLSVIAMYISDTESKNCSFSCMVKNEDWVSPSIKLYILYNVKLH